MIDRQALHNLDDAGLAAALRATAPAIDWPSAGAAGTDIATAVRARIVARPAGTRPAGRGVGGRGACCPAPSSSPSSRSW